MAETPDWFAINRWRRRLGRTTSLAPRRTPNDRADLVIHADDEKKDRYFVFECKRPDISDAEHAQAIEQACGNRASLQAKFAGAISGLTRRLLRFDDPKKYPAGERDRNVIADIPIRYGKPPQWRFYKGGFRIDKGERVIASDLPAVPREDLRSAIRKCHQSLWEDGRRSPIAAFGEFCKIVFVKHRDEKDPDRAEGEPYAFQRGDETADELAALIHKLYDAEKEKEPDARITAPSRKLRRTWTAALPPPASPCYAASKAAV